MFRVRIVPPSSPPTGKTEKEALVYPGTTGAGCIRRPQKPRGAYGMCCSLQAGHACRAESAIMCISNVTNKTRVGREIFDRSPIPANPLAVTPACTRTYLQATRDQVYLVHWPSADALRCVQRPWQGRKSASPATEGGLLTPPWTPWVGSGSETHRRTRRPPAARPRLARSATLRLPRRSPGALARAALRPRRGWAR